MEVDRRAVYMRNKSLKDFSIWKDNRQLRCGFTTGSCAAAAAKAAARMLLTGERLERTTVMTPAGILFEAEIRQIEQTADRVSCAVKKDGGDDPDVTNGLDIIVQAERTEEPGIFIDGGEGVGRVTRKGLDQPVGAAAINRVPRRMIEENVRAVMQECRAEGGMRLTVSVPCGEAVAQKTFNPRLGIEGGISILGTSGIVVPMSEKALIDTVRVDMRARIAQGNGYVTAVPGNYGVRFCEEQLGLDGQQLVICSNYIGETIDAALEFGAKGLLLVGHPGKFVKLAAGIMNTHSREADGRMEILAAHTIRCAGLCPEDCLDAARAILDCVTTDEALGLLKQYGILGPVMHTLMDQAELYVRRRAGEHLPIGVLMYSFEEGYLGGTTQAEELLNKVKENSRE